MDNFNKKESQYVFFSAQKNDLISAAHHIIAYLVFLHQRRPCYGQGYGRVFTFTLFTVPKI